MAGVFLSLNEYFLHIMGLLLSMNVICGIITKARLFLIHTVKDRIGNRARTLSIRGNIVSLKHYDCTDKQMPIHSTETNLKILS